mmetsp:Transcript_10347/g.31825  ORF Transcript_10347/g.31825 Transcript_10347/m.31825 type:complete len:327 (+) Transcript_10347:179-1159(+)
MLSIGLFAVAATASMAALAPGDASLYSASAVRTAQIEGQQHYDELERQGVLNIRRDVVVRARAPDGRPLEENEKMVHLIRHGQGFHNLLGDLYRDFGAAVDSTGREAEGSPYVRPEIEDSPLTAVGRAQAKALRVETKLLDGIDLVVLSPLQRAAQTAALAMPHLRHGRRVPWVGLPSVQETSGVNVCDRRRDRQEIVEDFPWVDWTALMTERDMFFDPDERESARSVSDRGYDFAVWLRARPEKEIVVATHSAWLFTFLNTVARCADPDLAGWFLTGELRSVVLSFEDWILTDIDEQVHAELGLTHPLDAAGPRGEDDLRGGREL